MTTLTKGDSLALTFRLEQRNSDTDTRTVEAAISSAEIVPDFRFGKVQLVHSAESIDMTRAEHGLVMLFNHDHDNPIGRIDNVRLDSDGVLRGSFRFSEHASAERYWQQVREGTLTDVSVGAEVMDYAISDDDDELMQITRWQPYEASIVSIGRNPRVGINQRHEGRPNMANDETAGTVTEPDTTPTATQVLQSHSRAAQAQQGKGVDAERKRQKAIRALFSKPRFEGEDYQTLMTHCLDAGYTIEQAQAELLDHIGFAQEQVAPSAVPFAPSKPEPQVVFNQSSDGRRTQVSMGASGEEKLAGGIELALAVKCGLESDEQARREAQSNGYVAMSLLEMGREMLRMRGVNVGNFRDNMQLAHELLTMSHSTSDFPAVLANIANKAVMIGYNEAPETWNQWCKVGNLTDFKQAKRVTTTAFPDLDKIPESGEYQFATISDVGEPIQLGTYGKQFRISRQALVNDDLNVFSDIPRKMGRAAARLPGNLAYAVLTANAALTQDSTELFHADHSNLGTAGAPSIATLQEAFMDMALQQDPDGNVTALNIEPQYLIVPRALRSTAKVLIGSEKDPTYDATNPGTPINEFYNAVTVISDARLDANSATAWYMAAAPSQADTVEVAFLNGNQSPVVDQMPMTSPDGRDYYVRLDAAAAALGYVGLYKNAGA
jgi:HK97 family phage prohead protease